MSATLRHVPNINDIHLILFIDYKNKKEALKVIMMKPFNFINSE